MFSFHLLNNNGIVKESIEVVIMLDNVLHKKTLLVKDLPGRDRPHVLVKDKQLNITLPLHEDPHLSTVSLVQNHAAFRRTIACTNFHIFH